MKVIRRRLLQLEKTVLNDEKTSAPRWLVLHFSYSDGGEVYEVRSLEDGRPYQRFRTESELEAWLRSHNRIKAA